MKSNFELFAALSAALLLASCQSTGGDAHAQAEESPFHCASCHTPEFKSTTRPPHTGARPETCGVCHSQQSWGHARVEHPWWALTGAHARAAADRALAGKENRVKCFWCHRGEPAQFAGTPKDCVGCHQEDREGVKFPEHDHFSSSCETCHSTEAWKPAQHPRAAAPTVTSTPSAATPPLPSKNKRTSPVARPLPQTPTPAPAPALKPLPTSPAPIPDITSHASRHH